VPERAKIAANSRRLKTERDRKKNPGDISNDIYVEKNSVSALSSLSVTETKPMEIDTADEDKKQVTFTHAIDIFVVRASASMEMSIVHNIFLKKFRLI
jgi:hypothetical protein